MNRLIKTIREILKSSGTNSGDNSTSGEDDSAGDTEAETRVVIVAVGGFAFTIRELVTRSKRTKSFEIPSHRVRESYRKTRNWCV